MISARQMAMNFAIALNKATCSLKTPINDGYYMHRFIPHSQCSTHLIICGISECRVKKRIVLFLCVKLSVKEIYENIHTHINLYVISLQLPFNLFEGLLLQSDILKFERGLTLKLENSLFISQDHFCDLHRFVSRPKNY